MRFQEFSIIVTLCCANSLSASSVYTSSTAFSAAIAGSSQRVENFGGLSTGLIINPGSTVDGITYVAFTPGSLIITSNYNSMNSNGRSLGGYNATVGIDYFLAGDQVTLSFSNPINELGVFFNANAYTGNLATFRVTAAGLSAVTGAQVFDTNTFVFAGLLSDASFNSATFSGSDFFTVPEIITAPAAAVPEPRSILLAIVGLTLFFAVRVWHIIRVSFRN